MEIRSSKNIPKIVPICNALALIKATIELGAEGEDGAKSENMMSFAKARLTNNLTKEGIKND